MSGGKAFDPYNFDYKSYLTELYSLTEMPSKLPFRDFDMDNYQTNSFQALRIEKNCKFIGMWDKYRLFYEKENGIDAYSLLNKDQPYICAQHEFRSVENGVIENVEIWNSRRFNKGLIRIWFRDEIIPKEKIIISDHIQSDGGFHFWESLFLDYVETSKTHTMYIFDYKTKEKIKKIENRKEMEEFFGNERDNFRFMLEKDNNIPQRKIYD